MEFEWLSDLTVPDTADCELLPGVDGVEYGGLQGGAVSVHPQLAATRESSGQRELQKLRQTGGQLGQTQQF